MANEVELKAKFILDYKEAIKGINKTAKAANATFQKQIRAESKHNKAKIREIRSEKRLTANQYKDDIKHQSDLIKASKGKFSMEEANRRKVRRAENTERREKKRYQREEERAAKGGHGGFNSIKSGVFSALSIVGPVAGFVMGGAIAGYQKHIEVEKARAQGIGQVPGSDLGKYKGALGSGYGADLGYNYAETAGNQYSARRATGFSSGREMQQYMRSRALTSGEASGAMATLTQSGYSFAGGESGGQSEGGKKLASMIRLAFYGGLKDARFIEFQQGITNLMQKQGSRSAGDIGMGAAIGAAMLSKTGLSGFTGERGAAMQARMDQAISSPKSEYSRGLMQRAFGYGPGGKSSWEQAEMRMEEGATGQNIKDIITQARKEGLGSVPTAAALKQTLGITMKQALPLVMQDAAGKLSLESAQKAMGGATPLEKESAKSMKGVDPLITHLPDIFNRYAEAGARVAEKMQAFQELQLKAFEWMLPKVMDVMEGAIGLAKDVGGVFGEAVHQFDTAVTDFKSIFDKGGHTSMQKAEYLTKGAREARAAEDVEAAAAAYKTYTNVKEALGMQEVQETDAGQQFKEVMQQATKEGMGPIAAAKAAQASTGLTISDLLLEAIKDVAANTASMDSKIGTPDETKTSPKNPRTGRKGPGR